LWRSAKVTRSGRIDVGTEWTAEFRLRGKYRQLKGILVGHVVDKKLGYGTRIKRVEFGFSVELVVLSRNRAQMIVTTSAKVQTLTARVLL
jgi:hypothetical protein